MRYARAAMGSAASNLSRERVSLPVRKLAVLALAEVRDLQHSGRVVLANAFRVSLHRQNLQIHQKGEITEVSAFTP